MIFHGSISKKILFSMLLVSTLITIIISTLELRYDFDKEMAVVERSMKQIEESHLSTVSRSLWIMDDQQIRMELDGIQKSPNLNYIEITDPNGKKVISIGSQSKNHQMNKTFPLTVTNGTQNVPIGTLLVTADLDAIYGKIIQKILILFLSQLFKTLSVSIICYFVIQRILTKHLIQIAQYLKDFDFNNPPLDISLERKPSPKGKEDELDTLIRNINNMKSNLITSYSALKDLTDNLELKVEEKTKIVFEQSQKLEQSSKMSVLGEMAGGVAHEINTPLCVIKTVSSQIQDLLEDEVLEKDMIKQMTQKVENTADHIAKIIKGLRTFSRESSKDPFQNINAQQLIEETLYFCNEKFRSSGITIDTSEIPKNISFEGKATELSQVLLNILNNAHDAIINNEKKWVKISALENNDWVEIRITDSGPGIPEAIEKKIFQPFFTTKPVGNMGMGLSISLGMVTTHNGTLTVDRQVPNTCFLLRIPKKQPNSLRTAA